MIAQRVLNCLKEGEKGWKERKQIIFVDKTKKMSSIISKRMLPPLNGRIEKKRQNILQNKNDISPKAIAEAQREISLVQERGMGISEILKHDLLTCPLFEGDFPAVATKSKLMAEISPTTSKWECKSSLPTSVFVDFMSKIRRMPLDEYSTLGELVDAVVRSAAAFCEAIVYLHFLLDSYIEFSLKEPERLRRNDGEDGIDVVNMSADSSTPKQPELFWASVENKRSIQRLCREIIFNKKSDRPSMYVSSVIENNEILPALQANGDPNGVPELSNWIEEADSQVIIHVNHSVLEHKCKRIVVLSNDRHFCATFALYPLFP